MSYNNRSQVRLGVQELLSKVKLIYVQDPKINLKLQKSIDLIRLSRVYVFYNNLFTK